jgi:hypothetical protein
MPADRVLGESLDSGLGSLTREDLEQYMPSRRSCARRSAVKYLNRITN